MPHIGCDKENCTRAREHGEAARVAAVAVQGRSGWWLLDATPDLPAQIHDMGSMPRGIFLTHAHIGHYTGLMYLGREGLGAHGMPVWCSARMEAFLRNNEPWSQLVELGQIELHVFRTDQPVALEEGLQLTAIEVPHRDEFSDTHAFHVEHADGGSLLFLPDIDRWSKWNLSLIDFLRPGAHLLLDATFYSAGELPNRDPAEIPHPLVQNTMDLLQPTLDAWPNLEDSSPSKPLATVLGPPRIRFIHLNHSNPLWDHAGPEARDLRRRGYHLAQRGAFHSF